MQGAIRKRPRLSIPLSSLVLLRLSAYSYLLPTAALSLSLSLSLDLDIQRRREQEDKQGVCRLAGAQEKIREFENLLLCLYGYGRLQTSRFSS